MSECPAEDELVRLVEGDLAAESLALIESHVAGCDTCGQVIAELGVLNRPDARRIGRYQLDRRIAAGGMGEVWAAWDPQLRRDIAVKLVRPDRADNGRERDRLLREARALARLGHPNVLAVHDVGEVDGEVFIATELVAGDTLASRGGANADWRQLARFYVQAARGLAAAHASGLVHRDVKPANLLLGADGRVRVADFGLAVRAQSDASAPPGASEIPDSPHDRAHDSVSITAAGQIAGTPAYMSPEQRLGAPVDARADQYALCVALAESIGGRRPTGDLDARTLAAFFAERRAREPELTALAAVLARGLEPDPDERFPDTGALADAIEDLVGARPATASGGTPAIDLRQASLRLPPAMVSLPPTPASTDPASRKSGPGSRSESRPESRSKSGPESRRSMKAQSQSRAATARSRRTGIAIAAAAAAIGFTGVLVAVKWNASESPRVAIGNNAMAANGGRPTAKEIIEPSTGSAPSTGPTGSMGSAGSTGSAGTTGSAGSIPTGSEGQKGSAARTGSIGFPSPESGRGTGTAPLPSDRTSGSASRDPGASTPGTAKSPTVSASKPGHPKGSPSTGTPSTGGPSTGGSTGTGTPSTGGTGGPSTGGTGGPSTGGTGTPSTGGTGTPSTGGTGATPTAADHEESARLLGEIPKVILRRDVKACRALLARVPANVHPTYANMFGLYRAACTMMAGDCAKGTAMMAKLEANPGGSTAPDIKARWVESTVNMYCPIEGSLDTRLTRMWAQLDAFTTVGSYSMPWCNAVLPHARKAASEVTDPTAKQLEAKILRRVASCVASANRCDEARELWQLSLATDASRAPATPALGSCP